MLPLLVNAKQQSASWTTLPMPWIVYHTIRVLHWSALRLRYSEESMQFGTQLSSYAHILIENKASRSYLCMYVITKKTNKHIFWGDCDFKTLLLENHFLHESVQKYWKEKAFSRRMKWKAFKNINFSFLKWGTTTEYEIFIWCLAMQETIRGGRATDCSINGKSAALHHESPKTRYCCHLKGV